MNDQGQYMICVDHFNVIARHEDIATSINLGMLEVVRDHLIGACDYVELIQQWAFADQVEELKVL